MREEEPSRSDTDQALEREFVVKNKYGLHARPAALFVKTASKFTCDILVEKDGAAVSGKSIMGLLTIEGHEGSVLKVTATGLDAQDALVALQIIFDEKFDEE